MKRFTQLYAALDETTKTNEKVAAMVDYYASASASDAAWATYFLSGQRLRQLIPTRLLRTWGAEAAGIPDWLFDESYDAVGDLAETIALVLPEAKSDDDASLTHWIEERLIPLRKLDESAQRGRLMEYWRQLDARGRFVLLKLVTGALRVGVSRKLVTRAIAIHSEVPAETVAHRLMGHWKPTAEAFAALIDPNITDAAVSTPYPFCLAHPIEGKASDLGDVEQFVAEWKWDGIRGQVIRRQGRTFVWSRGEELMEDRWPEIEAVAKLLPDGTVLDGEILACDDGQVLSFGQLQRRIGRKKVGKKLMSEVPVAFFAFDLLEEANQDLRQTTWSDRRNRLETLIDRIGDTRLQITRRMDASSWSELARYRDDARQQFAEGLMLKRRDSPYSVGRVRGVWWKWKIDPFTIDAVLIYAQRGHGRRASLYSDYTFAVWNEGQLVPFAKAYSGLDDAEIGKVDRFVRNNTNEKFGPVRSVTPELVMELAFEGINESNRHKSGIAVRFPRIVRWRHDKKPQDANSLDDLKAMLNLGNDQ
ncbi:MAG: ATP-dependent DNA ligase [Pirellulaceae bacterium]